MRSLRLLPWPVWMGARLDAFVVAVNELVTNAGRHGGGSGRMELRHHGDVLTCDVVDHGPGMEGMVVRLPSPTEVGGRGLWLAQQLTGTLRLTCRRDGLTAGVNVSVLRPPRHCSDDGPALSPSPTSSTHRRHHPGHQPSPSTSLS